MKALCLVTGADGFIGSALVREIALRERQGQAFSARGSVRRAKARSTAPPGCVVVGDIDGNTDWRDALAGVSVVLHTAARAHVPVDAASDSLAAYRRVNVDGSIRLAEQARDASVGRFVFVSTIGVNGNRTGERPFSADDPPSPQDPYALSKHEAEVALRQLLHGSTTQLVIVRPPLVYGPHARGNFRRLLESLASGWPLPLGAIHNTRSFVGLGNLVDLLILCLDHPLASGQTLLVSDGEDLSTTQFLLRLSRAMGKRPRLLPLPMWMLGAAARLLGRQDLVHRLCSDLRVDISRTCGLLNWTPPFSVDAGLAHAVGKDACDETRS